MNLIGHYVCADVPSREVRMGAVLPDLASLYRRKVRALAVARRQADGPHLGAGAADLLAGVQFHYAVDSDFHHSPLFERSAAALQQALLSASRAPGLKRFLPAHVLCELYLDHLLLRQNADLADAFYHDLHESRAVLTDFVAQHPLADATSFQAFLDRIVGGRFVDAYGSIAGILERMQRMLGHLGQRALDDAEQAAVAAWFDHAEAETKHGLTEFVERMRRGAPTPVTQLPAAPWRTEIPGAAELRRPVPPRA